MENGTRVPQFVVGNLQAGSYQFIGTKPKYFVTVRDRFTTSFTSLPSQKSRGLAGQVMHPLVSLCVVLQERNVVRIAQVTRLF